jgi:CBS domain containing-hemolysin-like protein
MPDGAEPSRSPAEPGLDQTIEPRRGVRTFWQRLTGAREHGLNGVLQSNGQGTHLSDGERVMIERIIAFDQKRVDDVAIPRADIIGVDADISLNDLLRSFSEANHSRLPVYRGDLDDPIGMVHIKDVVGLLADPASQEVGTPPRPILEGVIRKILYVPPSMPVTDLLLRMQASRIHMALVIDEFGGTDGLVTIEDLIELIVGDIRDEFDETDDFVIRQISEDRWEVDARAPLEDLLEVLGVDLALDDHDADTLGGLVFSLAGRVPLRGEVISHPKGPQFHVIDADPRRVRRIKVLMKAPAAVEPEAAVS